MFVHRLRGIDVVPSWVGEQARKAYRDFVGQFDQLVDTDVRWTPYTPEEVHHRAPQGLSSLCLRTLGGLCCTTSKSRSTQSTA